MTADTNCEEQSPLTHVLASGEYSVLITAAGSGYSRWRDIALTRWRGDPTCDAQGLFLYLKDVANGRVWSAGYQPVGREPDRYEVSFTEERARIVRADGPILTSTEILISPEDDTEVRRVHLTNSGRSTREIELTSYAEVVLADPAGDFAHPAFSKMFVQTEFVADGGGALLATRRHREPGEAPLWMFHIAVLEGEVSARCNSRPTARASSAGAATCARPYRSSMRCRCPTPRAPCSIRCSPCGAGRAFRPAALRGSTSGPVSRAAAPRHSPLPPNTATREHSSASRPRPRATPVRSSRSSRSTRMRRADFSGLQAMCSTPTARCAPRSRFSPETSRGRRSSGRAAYRAICRSYWCSSRPMAAVSWSGNCCGRASTGGASALRSIW
jgi:hypothetical protein